MKIAKSLLVIIALIFVSCSDSDDSAVGADESSLTVFEDSSSSLDEIDSSGSHDKSSNSKNSKASDSLKKGDSSDSSQKPDSSGTTKDSELSSSSQKSGSSGSQVSAGSSSTQQDSAPLNFEIYVPENRGCGWSGFGTAGGFGAAGAAGGVGGAVAAGFDDVVTFNIDDVAGGPTFSSPLYVDPNPHGVILSMTKKRIETLMAAGLGQDDAVAQSREELFKGLGLDSLLAGEMISDFILEYTFYYLYKDMLVGEVSREGNIVDDLADGKLDGTGHCINDRAYGTLRSLPREFMPIGCAVDPDFLSKPTLVMQNIWRKCAGLPFCNSERNGLFNADSTLICKGTSWVNVLPEDLETAGIPCDEDGKYFVSHMDSTRSYICKVETGWDTISTLKAETANVPCSKNGLLFKSVLNPGAIFVCRDSVNVGPYGSSKMVYKEWYGATPFESEVVDTPCDTEGKVVPSTLRPDSAHICRSGVWLAATRLEKETYGHSCDEEGKRVESSILMSHYYVCHEGEWFDFNDAPCKDGERFTTGVEVRNTYKTNYACKGGKWYSNVDSAWTVPYELYFNPDIIYGSLKDSRDGHEYRTIEYRGVTWMAENLKYRGTTSTPVADTAYCLSDGCANTGYFYTAENASQVCPDGWSLPTKDMVTGLLLAAREENGKFRTIFSRMSHMGIGFDGLDTYGLSFTNTGVLNGVYHVNYDYQYLWFTENSGDIALAEITVYKVDVDDCFGGQLGNIKSPVRCVKK